MNESKDNILIFMFKNQFKKFFDDILSAIPDEYQFIKVRHILLDKIDSEKIIQYIKLELCPLKKMIEDKNEDFFLKHKIFDFFLNKYEVHDYFKQLWLFKIVNNDDKDMIWKWFSAFIVIATMFTD
jgi:hypothetical protein